LNSSSGTLTAAPSPATVQQNVTLSSTFAPGVSPLGGAGAPSGTVTFTSGTTTLGTAKLVLDQATATLQGAGAVTISALPVTGMVTADFNGDGIPDLVFGDNNASELLHVDLGNTPYGNFQVDLTSKLGGNCNAFNNLVAGDLNGDGFADLVMDCYTGGGLIYVYSMLSHGDGTFATPVQITLFNGGGGIQLALKDMNKDGKLDLVAAGQVQGNQCVSNCSGFILFTGNGDGSFTQAVTTSISGFAASNLLLTDIDGDGYPDVVELNNASQGKQSIDIYFSNNATAFGTSAAPVYTPSYSVPLTAYPAAYKFLFAADFNGDGLPDLGTVLTPSGSASVVTALNTSSAGKPSFGALSSLAVNGPVGDIVSADINGDGFSDLMIVLSTNANAAFFEADGKGGFANSYTGLKVTGGTVLDILAADLNSDGYADAVLLAPGQVSANATYQLAAYVTTGKANASLNTTFAQSGTPALTATWPGNINFSGATGKFNLTVNAASSATSLGTSGTPSVYGQPVTFSSTVTSTVATGTPTGTITFLDGSVPLAPPVTMAGGSASLTISTLGVGQHGITAVYSGDTVFGGGPSSLVTQVVNQAQPIITWNPLPATITYGTPLVAGQLNATAATPYSATVPGKFNYTQAAGTVLGAGTQTLNVSFTPTDTADFKTATGTASLTVNQAKPTITWSPPASIVVGTALSAAQLNATATSTLGTVAGSFVYNPAAGAVLPVGANQALAVTFNPTDTLDYTIATGATTITVIPLAVSTVAPASVGLNAAATAVTLNGTGFLPNSVVSINGTPVVTTYNGPTSLSFTVPASYLLTPQTLQIAVNDPTQGQTSAAVTFTVVAPVAAATFTGPPTVQPAQQPSLNFALTAQYPVAITGTVTLSFTSSTGVVDPAIQFASGGTTLTFTIPANSTTTPTLQLQSGTVTGTIACTLVLTAGGQVITPANIQPISITVPPAAPIVTSFTLTRSGNSVTANLIGFSNTRELSQAVFHFGAANGSTINTPDITVPATAIFASWFTNVASQAYGSSFLYTQPFSLSSDQSAVGTVSVTLTNSAGVSTTYTAQ
jgi:hypothetical protein